MGGLFIVIWTTLILELVSGDAGCLPAWFLRGNTDHKQCMRCVGATAEASRKTWRGALDFCNENGGTLTGIHNTQQDTFVRTCVTNIVNPGPKFAYIGLLRPFEGGANGFDQVWTDGKAVTFGLEKISDGMDDEDCFVMSSPGSGFKYRDWECTKQITFVCSKEPSTCLLPDAPQHATVVQAVTGPARFAYSEDTLGYTCDTGYATTDPPIRTCQLDGTWDEPAPVCELVVCPPLTAPDHGHVDTPEDRTYQAQACFRCDDGYQLIGNEILTCKADETWNGQKPTCVQVCPPLEDPLHGLVTINGFVNGQTATYTCAAGHLLPVPDTRTCNDGEWSAAAPTCISDCADPGDPVDGTVNLTQDEHVRIATFTCSPGHEISGARTIACLATGQWSTDPPTCQKTCRQLNDPQHGDVSVASTSESFRAFYTCDEGYMISGSDVRVCLLNGAWSGMAPTCIEEPSCGQLEDPVHGDVSVASTAENFRAFYTCNDGYVIRGSDVRACLMTEQWSGTAPICIEDTSRSDETASSSSTKLEDNLPFIIGGSVAGALLMGVIGAMIGVACARGTATRATPLRLPAPGYPRMRPRGPPRQIRPYRRS